MCQKTLWALVVLNLLATAGLGYYTLSGEATKKQIAENPQAIIESVNAHMQAKQSQSEEQALEIVKANRAFLYEDARHPFIGNKDATFTVVEFLDYNCGYCKKAHEAVTKVLETDQNVKFVMIEIPILHETSALAARWALAAHDAGGYVEFHAKLLEHKGPINEDILSGFAKAASLDVEAVKAKANSGEIEALVSENLNKSSEIGIQGTPAFIIGDEIVRGYLPYEELKAAIERARAKGQ